MKLSELMKLGMSMAKISKIIKKTSSVSIGEYTARFKSETLRRFMLSYMPEDYQLMAFLVSLATFTSGNGNIPAGTSMDFSNRMKDKYLLLGGQIKLKSTVSEIKIINKSATQVVTSTGEIFSCDYVVPACDSDIVFHKILKSKYNDKKFKGSYQDDKTNPLIGNCYFAYAIDSTVAKELPHLTMIEVDSINVCNKNKTLIGLKVYDYIDNGNGLTTAISPLLQDGLDYSFWEHLYNTDRVEYKSEKLRIGGEILNELVKQYPKLEGKIKLIDSATPVTYSRYLGAYKGSYMAFMLTKKSKQMMHSGKIKGIRNCFMAGQWLITPGGLPTAVVTGKFAIQRICKQEKKVFIQ